jgi:hypothetical protein
MASVRAQLHTEKETEKSIEEKMFHKFYLSFARSILCLDSTSLEMTIRKIITSSATTSCGYRNFVFACTF